MKKKETSIDQSNDAKEDIIHTVKPGDSLRSIAYHYYGDTRKADKIAAANNLATSILRVGRELRIPD